MCEICDTHVLDKSKHCGACNRCVNDFDHHCRWINNCVGSKNYQDFLRLIVAAFLMAFTHNISNAFMIWLFTTEDSEIGETHVRVFGRQLHEEFLWLLWIAVSLNLLTMAFLGHLIFYHVRLWYYGKTTFEYIRWKQNRSM